MFDIMGMQVINIVIASRVKSAIAVPFLSHHGQVEKNLLSRGNEKESDFCYWEGEKAEQWPAPLWHPWRDDCNPRVRDGQGSCVRKQIDVNAGFPRCAQQSMVVSNQPVPGWNMLTGRKCGSLSVKNIFSARWSSHNHVVLKGIWKIMPCLCAQVDLFTFLV